MSQHPTTTNFPQVGTEMAHPVNRSAEPGKGMLVPKTGNAKGGMAEPATATHREGVWERNGNKGAPQVAYSYPQAPEASQTYRNVRLFRSSVGNRDFYEARARSMG